MSNKCPLMLPKVKWFYIEGYKIGIGVAKPMSVDVAKGKIGLTLKDVK